MTDNKKEKINKAKIDSIDSNVGVVTQVISAVVDVRFPANDKLPNMLNALECKIGDRKLVLEVAQHIGDSSVRCIALDSTDGLARGSKAIDTGKTIHVPVGKGTLGRIMNVIGEPIDEKGPINTKEYSSIYRTAPTFSEQSTERSILVTGIKVIDLLAPYAK
jgi:F-type H+-transporting ATPase subunit beta